MSYNLYTDLMIYSLQRKDSEGYKLQHSNIWSILKIRTNDLQKDEIILPRSHNHVNGKGLGINSGPHDWKGQVFVVIWYNFYLRNSNDKGLII